MFAQFVRRHANKIPARYLRVLGNWWSPFRGAGIRIIYTSPDSREIHVQMRLRWFNRNYVGTHFGGSLYAMTDPFYMIMLINNLGKGYIVWDKAACIEFKKPGKGTVNVRFVLSEAEIQAIKDKADALGKFEFEKYVEVMDTQGEVIAAVTKTLYVRKRNFKKTTSAAASG
jgi:acyl-coenzyme A thioesterase PaaI-like protein